MKRCFTIATVQAISFFVGKWLLTAAGQYHFVRDNEHYDLENYAAAVEAYNAVIEDNPPYTDAYYNRAMSLSNLGECRAAVEDFS